MTFEETRKIKLYFDADLLCLGGVANHWWQRDYQGDYWASEYHWLPVGFDPVGKTAKELAEYRWQSMPRRTRHAR